MNDLAKDHKRIEGLLKKYDAAVPRYTSYPPIPYWGDSNEEQVKGWLADARGKADNEPLSIYVHIPFCRKRCLYCGCFVIISPKKDPADPYMDCINREMELMRESMGVARPVRQFHLGGGTPTFISMDAMTRLVETAKGLFPFEKDVEMSIEVDPRTVDTRQLEHLRSLGFNRVSLGVQDFHEKVQKAVDRIQPYDQVERLVTAGKNLGFLSVNFDLIYGLPYQTRETYEHTLDKVIELRPGRIAMYNFAYLPKSMPFQRRLDPESLPNPDEKLAIFMLARERLGKAGYQYIGLDHFALNEDDLSVSYRDGSMRRNFMGYTTQAGTDLLAFGVSGITEFQGKFWQNEKKLNRYEQIINDGHLPIIRGMELSPDDLMRKSLISALFCESGFDFAAMAEKFDPKLRELLEYEVQALKPLQEDGLVELSDKGIRVTVDGQLFLRNIAVLFDNHLRSRERPAQFSRTV